MLFDEQISREDAYAYRPPAEEQPGGYDWGAALQPDRNPLPGARGGVNAGPAADAGGMDDGAVADGDDQPAFGHAGLRRRAAPQEVAGVAEQRHNDSDNDGDDR